MKYLRFLNPLVSSQSSYRLLGVWARYLYPLAVIILLVGAIWGLFFTPPDYQQGESYRIIFVHVPMAFLAQSIYLVMAANYASYIIWKIKFCDWVAEASAPIGAAATLFAIASGAIWGKPTWGAYWVWDARLTSMLILFLLYLSILTLRSTVARRELAAKICAYTAIVGSINIPIIKYSVEWWFTLHQGATLKITSESSIDSSMIWPLLIMIVACYIWYGAGLCARVRTIILRNEINKSWVRELP